MPEITELTNRELIKKLIAFFKFKSFSEFKKLTYQQLIRDLDAKKEDVQKQHECQILLKQLHNINQEKWEQLLKEEEQAQQEEALVEQIKQGKVILVAVAKTTDNTEENTSYLLILSPKDQEKTIQTIRDAYLTVTGQLPQSKGYENIEKFIEDEPNINLPENIRNAFTLSKIQLEVYVLTFSFSQFKQFSSTAEMKTLINEKNIHLVDVEKTNQENQIFRQFIFFPRPAFNSNKNTDEDKEKEHQHIVTGPKLICV